MHIRTYHRDPKELLKEGQAIMSSSETSKYYFRVFAVNMVLGGSSAAQIASSSGFTRAAISGWVKSVDEKGFDALRDGKHTGRPTKLSEAQMAEIDRLLETDPKEMGRKVWDGPALSQHILDTYGIKMGVRQCQRLFHKLGYSRIRPQTYPGKGQEGGEEREAFKKTEGGGAGHKPHRRLPG